MRHLTLVLCLLPLFVTACSSAGFMARMDADAGAPDDSREIFGDIERLEFAKKIQVELPAKLGVADIGRDSGSRSEDTRRKRKVALLTKLGEDTSAYRDVVSVTGLSPNGEAGAQLEDLRRKASAHQADLVLAFERREAVHTGHNFAAIFKILLLPMLFLHTEENTVVMDVRAVVMDTRNGLLYTTFDDHVERVVTASEAGETAAMRAALDTLFDETSDRMREEVGRKLRDLR